MKKDGFIIYARFEEQVERLDDTQAGILFKALLRYQSGKNLPAMDQVTGMAFSFIAAAIDANNKKYAETCAKRSEAGKKGNEKRWGQASQKSQMRQNETVCDNLRQEKEEDIEKEFDTEKEIEEKGRAPNRARNGERQKNRFNQFTQNDYDFDELEKKLISN